MSERIVQAVAMIVGKRKGAVREVEARFPYGFVPWNTTLPPECVRFFGKNLTL